MKNLKKILGVLVGFIFLSIVLVGCSPTRALKSISKNLTNYQISVKINDAEKILDCEQNVEYVNNYDCELAFICFNLYPSAFREDSKIKPYSNNKLKDCFPNGMSFGDIEINSVKLENKDANYKIEGENLNCLTVELWEPLFSGEKVNILISFKVKLAECTHRLGYYNNNINLGNWYPIAAVYENGEFQVEPYFANGDPFYSQVANYDVTISYPAKYLMASSGYCKDSRIENEIKVESYTALAVRDFAMCLSSDYIVKSVEVEDVVVTVYAYANDEKIDEYLQTSVNAITLFNEIFGKYPYTTLSVAFTGFFQGGMEYPNLVYISDVDASLIEIKKIIVHEIAHQWWYSIVGNNEISEAWIDEGLAEYSTLLYFENYANEEVDSKKMADDAKINFELYIDVLNSLGVEYTTKMNLRLDEYVSEYEYVYMVYVKGLLFFDDLRNVIGDEDFFNGLQEVYKLFRFKIITQAELVACFEKVSGLDLTEFVESWLQGTRDIKQN